MNAQERVANRKFLLANDIRPRGMTDEEVAQKVKEIEAGQKPTPSKRDKAPSKKPEAFKLPEGMPEQGESKPEPKQDKPESKPTNGSKPDTGALAGSIEKIIQDALGASQAPAIDETAIIALIQKHSQAPTRIEYSVNVTRPDGEQKKIPKAHKILNKVLDVAAIGENVFLAGPAACGKTTLAAQTAEALGFDFQFTGAVADQFQLSGFIDANGTYHESSFYKALNFEERGFEGCVFLLDEGDASLPPALLAANSAFENGYFAFPNKTIKFDINKVFFIVAANTLGKGANRQYTGRYPLDDAFLNRFERMEMDYDIGVEINMAEGAWLNAGGKETQKQIALDWAHEVIAFRRQLADKAIVALISPRHTRRGAALLARGWKLEEVRAGLYTDLNADHCKTLGVKK